MVKIKIWPAIRETAMCMLRTKMDVFIAFSGSLHDSLLCNIELVYTVYSHYEIIQRTKKIVPYNEFILYIYNIILEIH